MDLRKHQENWNKLALENSPKWVVDTRKIEWGDEEFFETGVDLINEVVTYMKDRSLYYSNGRALDFGCGVGRLSQALADHFDHVVGIDISEEMIKQANRKNKKGDKCSFKLISDEVLTEFEGHSFDVVFTYSTLQHIEPFYVKKYLSSFMRILKPGGLMIFQEHAYPYNSKERAKNFVKGILPRIVVNKIKSIKNGDRPIMELFSIPKNEIFMVIENNGGEIENYRAEANASRSHKTYLYFARKKSA